MQEKQVQDAVGDKMFKAANDVYSFYFISPIMGYITLLAGGIWAGMQQRKSSGWLQSHFIYQAVMAKRVMLIFLSAFVVLLLDRWLHHWRADTMAIVVIMAVVVLGVVVWFIRCMIAGYQILQSRRGIACPKTWARPRPDEGKTDCIDGEK